MTRSRIAQAVAVALGLAGAPSPGRGQEVAMAPTLVEMRETGGRGPMPSEETAIVNC